MSRSSKEEDSSRKNEQFWKRAAIASTAAAALIAYRPFVQEHMPWPLWARKNMSYSQADIMFGLRHCLRPAVGAERQALFERVEKLWAPGKDDTVVALCVRSVFDALLTALALPAGSEVLCSAVTISDMPRIIRQHGLEPIPVDFDNIENLYVNLELAEKLVTPRTKLFVVAPLFGTHWDMGPIFAFAKRHNLLVVEDYAQAYDGIGFTGNSQALITMFSFGSIKTDSAVGGALATVRDPEILRKIRAILSSYDIQPLSTYVKKLWKHAGLRAFCSPDLIGLFSMVVCPPLGIDLDELITRTSRGFPNSASFFNDIRKQPCSPLLALLERRLKNHTRMELAAREAAGRMSCAMIPKTVLVPGVRQRHHSFWVFPVVCANPDAVIRSIRSYGFDATRGASQLHAVRLSPELAAADKRRAQLADPIVGDFMLKHLVYLPVYNGLPEWAHRRLSAALHKTCTESLQHVPNSHIQAHL